MYCHLCGAEVSETADTCPECGVDLDAELEGPSDGAGAVDRDDVDRSEPESEPTVTGSPDAETGEQSSGSDALSEQAHPSDRGEQASDPEDRPSPDEPDVETETANSDPDEEDVTPPWEAETRPPSDAQTTTVGGQQGAQPGHGSPVESAVDATGSDDSLDPQPSEDRSDDGYAADPGGEFDLGALVERVPLLWGGIAGAITGLAVFGLGWLVSIPFPPVSDVSSLSLGALVTMDLHFATPGHATPFLFADYQTADPPNATLGFLYLLAPLLLYQVSKLVVDFGIDGRDIPLLDGMVSGATVLVGYLPVMLLVAVLAPSRSAAPEIWLGSGLAGEFSLASGLLLAGLVYPLVFGAIGGLSAAYFSPDQRRVGLLYGVVGFLTGLVAVFVASYVYVDTSKIELGIIDRLINSVGAFVQIHTLSFIDFGPYVSLILPLVLVLLVIGAMGFLRVWRSVDITSPVDAFTRAITPVVTYAVLVGLLSSVSLLAADPWIQRELDLGAGSAIGFGYRSVATMFPELLSTGPFMTIGSYVTVVGQTFLLLPIVLGGTCGVIAWAVDHYTDETSD